MVDIIARFARWTGWDFLYWLSDGDATYCGGCGKFSVGPVCPYC